MFPSAPLPPNAPDHLRRKELDYHLPAADRRHVTPHQQVGQVGKRKSFSLEKQGEQRRVEPGGASSGEILDIIKIKESILPDNLIAEDLLKVDLLMEDLLKVDLLTEDIVTEKLLQVDMVTEDLMKVDILTDDLVKEDLLKVDLITDDLLKEDLVKSHTE